MREKQLAQEAKKLDAKVGGPVLGLSRMQS